MNRPTSSKYVPGLSADDDIDTQTNSQGDNSIKIYDGVAECTMNDADTLKSVKSRAKDLAIQKVQQKIADYVYGFWKDRYLTLPDDEVLSIASEICTITDVKYNFIDSDDNALIRATVLAQINDNDVMNYIIQFFKERNELKSQVEALRKENEDLRRQIEDLKRQRDKVSNEKSILDTQNKELKRQIDKISTEKYVLESKNKELQLQISELKLQLANNQKYNNLTDKERISLAFKKAEEADRFLYQNRYKDAIKLYDEAIQLNPNSAKFYYYRGRCYEKLGRSLKANEDFAKSKELGW